MIGDIVIYAGIAVAFAGVCMILYCITSARKIQQGQVDPATIEARLKRLILLNGAGVGVGFFGLAIMVIGIMV